MLEPGIGALGSLGERGVGRLPEPAELLAAVEARARAPRPARDLDGLRVLVTAGGTREPIDAVRFVGNRSSGRMGFALADEAARRGAAGDASSPPTSRCPRRPASTTSTSRPPPSSPRPARERFDGCDVLLMAAAVADYRPADGARGKIKKDEPGEALALELERTDDVLTALAAAPPPRPDARRLRGRARRRRARLRRAASSSASGSTPSWSTTSSRPGIGFDAADNEVTIVTADGERPSRGPPRRRSRAPSSTRS